MPDQISFTDPKFKVVADYYGLETPWLQAMVRIESGGFCKAHRWESHILDYSLGLCQVLTSTAAWMLGNAVAFPIPQELWKSVAVGVGLVQDRGTKSLNQILVDPLVALHLGAAYLSYQLKRYDGNISDAIAAYNAGSVRRTSDGMYVNQRHVDRFHAALTEFEGVSE